MAAIQSWRRLALTSAALPILMALVVAAVVIPAVYAATVSGAEPRRAAAAFWVHAGLNVLTGAVAGLLALRARGRSTLATIAFILCAFVALLLALALTDAASAFMGHGASLRATAILLFVGSAIEALAAVLIVVAAFRCPRKPVGA